MGRLLPPAWLRRGFTAAAIALATPATAGVDAVPLEAIAYHPPAAAIADPDARCRYVVNPTTLVEEAPMKLCAKAFVDLISAERIKAAL